MGFKWVETEPGGQDIYRALPVEGVRPGPIDAMAAGALTSNWTVGAYRAAERQANFLKTQQGRPEDPNFNFTQNPLLADKPQLWPLFNDARSDADVAWLWEQYQQDLQSFDTIKDAEWGELYAMIGASVSAEAVTPIAPLAWTGRGLSLVQKGARGAALVTAMNAPMAAAHDFGHASVTAEETAMGMAVLAGLGAGASILANIGKSAPQKLLAPPRGLLEDLRPLDAATFGGDDEFYKSVGAAASPGFSPRSRYFDRLDEEGFIPTGTKIEDLPLNPVFRLAKSASLEGRVVVQKLVDQMGIKRNKNIHGQEATHQSAESLAAVNWTARYLQAYRDAEGAYLQFIGSPVDLTDGTITTGFKAIKGDVKARFAGMPDKGRHAFNKRVRREMLRPGTDGDEAVATAASAYRKMLDEFNEGGRSSGLWNYQNRQRLAALQKEEDKWRAMAKGPDRTAGLNAVRQQIDDLKYQMDQINKYGHRWNNGLNYVPRIWRIDRLLQDPEGFIDDIIRWMETDPQHMNLSRGSKQAKAKQIWSQIVEDDNALTGRQLDDQNVSARSFERERTLSELPDDADWMERWVETDIDEVMSKYQRNVGIDIELMRNFDGDLSLQTVAEKIRSQYEALINRASSGEEVSRLRAQRDRDITDIFALRDRLRGTYGLSKNPFSTVSRAVRGLKSFNVLAYMGGAAVAALPDVARVMMLHGLEGAIGPMFQRSMGSNREIFQRMMRDELLAVSEAADMILGTRALQMMDLGDAFGRRFYAEEMLNKATGPFMLLNGLHMWNTVLKEMAGTVSASAISKAAFKMARGGGVDEKTLRNLAASGISETMAVRIGDMIAEHGQGLVPGGWTTSLDGADAILPNTARWTDTEAKLAFQVALRDEINRAIVTPGAGDRALWTSTEFGSLLAQFKGFGQASIGRVLVSGLQDKDKAFWTGAAIMVFMGGMVNELRRTLRGQDEEGPITSMIEAVDQSGLLASFSDANAIMGALTDNKLSMQGLAELAGEKQNPYFTERFAGTVMGPSGSTVTGVGNALTKMMTGQSPLDSLPIPGQTLPYVEAVDYMTRTPE